MRTIVLPDLTVSREDAKDKEYIVYRVDEYAGQQGDNILIARPCIECGDQLLGTPESLKSVEQPHCEPGHCYSRPGVWY